MFNPLSYENSRPKGFGTLEIMIEGHARSEPDRLFVPLRRTELRGEIVGPLASLCLIQVFAYTMEQHPSSVEAVYRFPLPGDAVVRAVRVRFGDVEIDADLKERGQAKEEYAQARNIGQQATLLQRESPGVFTLAVTGIQPDQEIKVETSYVLLTRTEGAGWLLRLPLTIAPRYSRSDEFDSRHAQGQPLLLLADPGHRFALDIDVLGSNAVSSVTHQIVSTRNGDRQRVQLREGEVIPDRDFVLTWLPIQDEDRPLLHVFAHDDDASDYLYFLAMVSPPVSPSADLVVPREVVLLVDHSGSMEGAKWQAADWAVKKFLRGLRLGDTFALGLFHNSTRWFAESSVEAGPEAIEQAIEFLSRQRDSGGTELGVALEQALSVARLPGEYTRHVLLITDAQVTDEGRILRLVEEEAAKQDRRRISVMCIDASPNSYLALQLAEKGGGIAKFLTSSPEEEDIATVLDEILADWAQPTFADLQLLLDREALHIVGGGMLTEVEQGWSAMDVGDLPAGRSRWVVGRVPRAGNSDLQLRLISRKDEIATGNLEADEGLVEMSALKTLFGARQILILEQLLHAGHSQRELADRLQRLGYDPDAELMSPSTERPRVYVENERRDTEKSLRALLMRESLNYGVLCSETSFVAVRKERGGIVRTTVPVGNTLPAGWSQVFTTDLPVPGFLWRRTSAPTVMSIRPASLGFDDEDYDMPMFRRGSSRSPGLFSRFRRMVPPSGTNAGPRPGVVFSGVPEFQQGQSLLFDSMVQANGVALPDSLTFSQLIVRFLDTAPFPGPIPPGLVLMVFIGDLALPRATIQVADLIQLGGERPLNLRRPDGQRVLLVLQDDAGLWAKRAPKMEVSLSW